MTGRAFRFCALLFALAVAWPVPAFAAGATLTISVTSAQTNAPLALAAVNLSGPQPLSGVTDRFGTVVFSDVIPGAYQGFATAPGFRPTQIADFRVQIGSTYHLDVTLSKLLRVIGTVVVTQRAQYDPNSVGSSSAQQVSSGSLGRMLQNLPGLQLETSANGQTHASVNGHTYLETPVLADGLPIAPAGTTFDLRTLNLSLFDSATVESNALDLGIPDPTLASSVFGSGRLSNRAANTTFFARGTAGYVGYSVGLASGGTEGPLDGSFYADSSGLAYNHDDAGRSASYAIKTRIPLSSRNVISTLLLHGHSDESLSCNSYNGLLPCGYGPGNASASGLTAYQLRDSALLGHATASLALYDSELRGSQDSADLQAFGVKLPLVAAYAASVWGFDASAALSGSAGQTFELSAKSNETAASGNSALSYITSPSPAYATHSSSIGASYDVQITNRVSGHIEIGVNAASGAASPQLFEKSSATWRPNGADVVRAGVSSGTLVPPPNVTPGFSLPETLQFDCAAGTAVGSGPSAPLEASQDTLATLSITHRIRSMELVLNAQREIVQNEPIPAYLDGGAFSGQTYPPGYLASLNGLFAGPLACDKPGNLTSGDLALRSLIPGRVVHNDITLAGRFALSPRLQLEPYIASTTAYDTSDSTQLAKSTILPGYQLPGLPPMTVGLTADWRSTDRAIEFAALVRHVAANNADALPAYTIVDAGARARLVHGMLSVALTNVFNTDAFELGSFSQSYPLARNAATPLRIVATPLAGRTFQVSYRFTIGAPVKPAAATAQYAGLPTSASIAPIPISRGPGTDPLGINMNSAACGPEIAAIARPILERLRAYVASGHWVEKRSLGNGITAYLRALPNGSYALLLGGGSGVTDAALFSCSHVHVGTIEDVEAAGGYAPTQDDRKLYVLIYSPRIGLYFTYDLRNAVIRHTATISLPTSPPSTPFELGQPQNCTTDIRGAAEYILKQLEAYFSALRAGTTPPPLDGVTITPRPGRAPWYTISFPDPAIAQSIRSCAVIHAGTLRAIRAFGVDAQPGNLQFAKALGIYEATP